MKSIWISIIALAFVAGAYAQETPPPNTLPLTNSGATSDKPRVTGRMDSAAANLAEKEGIEVEIKNIARFRGVRRNQLLGYGLVVGLEGTGDTKRTPFTSTLLANALKKFGTMIDPATLDAKNVATVAITAELPPYSTAGNSLDVTVTSIGDAKSLQGGYLLQAPLYGANDDQNAIAVAMGSVSIGGFNASGGAGGSVQKNHVNAGRIPSGAIVEKSVPYQVVYNGKMYLELDEGDLTTANRIVAEIRSNFPELAPYAVDGGTISLTLGDNLDSVEVMSRVEKLSVKADLAGLVIINERTGTIVIGGNVRIGPAVIAQGNLKIVIEAFNDVSQPAPLSGGSTQPIRNETVNAKEESQIGLVSPVTTISDLARTFQALKIAPRDMITILQALKEQGALKARIRIQ